MKASVGAPRQLLRLTGVVSVGAALVAFVADELLQYSSHGYASFLYLQHIDSWRVFAGYLLGVLAIPLTTIGYWQITSALQVSGIKHTRLMFWIIAYGIVMGAVGHGVLTAFVVMIQLSPVASLNTILSEAQTYGASLVGIFLLCELVVSLWYCIVVLSRHTLYPKWMICVNPLLLSLLILLLHMSNILPIVDNVLYPAWLSTAHIVFFTCSTLVLWKGYNSGVLL